MNTKGKYLCLFFLFASILAACSAPAPAPTAIPAAISTSTPVPAPTLATDGSAAITNGFWDAVLANDIDTAMAFVADDVQTSGGPTTFSDKVKFSAFMSTKSKSGFTYEISDLRIVSEDTVTYDMKVYEKGTLITSGLTTLQIADGKIVKIKLP